MHLPSYNKGWLCHIAMPDKRMNVRHIASLQVLYIANKRQVLVKNRYSCMRWFLTVTHVYIYIDIWLCDR